MNNIKRSCTLVKSLYNTNYRCVLVSYDNHTSNIRWQLQSARKSFLKNFSYPFCSASNEPNTSGKKLLKNEIKTYINQNKERLRDTEIRLKKKGTVILQDIKDTRDKVRNKVEEVIEVWLHKLFNRN